MATPATPVSSAAPPAAGSQEAVNTAADFESAASSVLEMDAPETPATPVEVTTDATTDAAKADAAPAPDAAKPAEAAAAAADPYALDAAKLQAALADPNQGAFVKELHEKYQRAIESTKIWGAEAQEARSLVPGGLPELKETVDVARSARAEAADFASGVPDRQKSALQAIADEHPEQFAAGIPVYMEIAGAKNPQARETYLRGELQRTLEGDGVVGALQTAFSLMAKGEAATPEDEQAFGQAMGQLREWADKAGFASAKPASSAAAKAKPVDPELTAAREKLAKYEADEKKATVDNFTAWYTPVNEEISKGVREDARARLEDFLPKNVEKNFRDMTMNDLLDKVERELTTQLRADTGHNEKLAAVLAGNAWKTKGAEAKTQYLNLSTGRAKQLLPFIVEKLMKPLTQAAVAGAEQKTAAQKAAAARPDVTGAGGTARPNNWKVKDVQRGGALSGKTDEELLDL